MDKKVRVADLTDGIFYEISLDEVLTQLYETTKRLVEERNVLLTQITEQLEDLEEAVAIMAVIREGENFSAKAALIDGLLAEVTRLSDRITDLKTASDRFSSMRKLMAATLIRVTPEQAKNYGF